MNFEKGIFYHIYNRGNNGQKIFFNRDNYLYFIKKIENQLTPFVSIVAWCLIPNHFHLVVYVHKISVKKNALGERVSEESNHRQKTKQIEPEITLNYAIGVLLRSYARAIQKQEHINGSLFQQHTQAKALIDEIKIDQAYWNTAFGAQFNVNEGKSYLETCIEYVHLNPVASGLVNKPEDWDFSSYKEYNGEKDQSLVDLELLRKEGLVISDRNISHSMTQSQEGVIFSHSITRSHTMTNIAIIGIGSNIDAESNIPKMMEILKTKVLVEKVSTFLKTKPVGIENQPDFTNGAVKILTPLNIEELTQLLKGVEDQVGRDRTAPKFGPRTIDLDIVVWNGKIVDDDYYTRDFLRQNVAEVS